MMNQNLPIAYDYHGDIPFHVPFSQIKPADIHIYLDLDTKTGKNTCGQNCNHCWFVNYEKVHNKSFDMQEGQAMKQALEKIGYKVFARYVDSFAFDGDFMRIYGPAHNRSFYQLEEHVPTDTMKKGDAWTSGRPLLGENYVQLLDTARESGYGTISITYHGLIDENFKLREKDVYPIKGVFTGAETEQVIARIRTYNANLKSRGLNPADGFRINIGVTVGRHNHGLESLTRYVHYFNALGVETVRFNNFTDHGRRHPHLQMKKDEIEKVYRDLKWIHDNMKLNFQLAVSEDFGTFGIEVMGFPKHVGWCRAGRQLFTVIPSVEETILKTEAVTIQKIGDIVACVNIFQPFLGILTRTTSNGVTNYSLEFDHAAVDAFTEKRVKGVYKNGCFARELLEESPLELTQQARKAIDRSRTQSVDVALEVK